MATDRVRIAKCLGDEYYYNIISICVIDSVFSIGARYEGVKNVIGRYCARFNLKRFRPNRSILPNCDSQESIATFLKHYEQFNYEYAKLAMYIFENRQRTSTKNGILKSEAAFKFAKCLQNFGVNYLQDIDLVSQNPAFERCILSIAGQGSGISLKYFLMLAGSEQLIKPDRMIKRFIRDAIGKSVDSSEAHELLIEVAGQLQAVHPNVTPRLLDYAIWSYQRRSQKSCRTGCYS